MTPTAAILPFPEKPEDRLRRALRALDAALAEQGAAVAGLRLRLRHELGALSGAVDGLGTSLQAYSRGLTETQEAALGAHAEARRLEATADAMLAACKA
jgi:signal transduction histidine kinase